MAKAELRLAFGSLEGVTCSDAEKGLLFARLDPDGTDSIAGEAASARRRGVGAQAWRCWQAGPANQSFRFKR